MTKWSAEGNTSRTFFWSKRTLEKYLTPEETAQYLRSSKSTLAKRRLNGTGPIFVRIGRAVRYRQSDVDAWLESSASRQSVRKIGDAR